MNLSTDSRDHLIETSESLYLHESLTEFIYGAPLSRTSEHVLRALLLIAQRTKSWYIDLSTHELALRLNMKKSQVATALKRLEKTDIVHRGKYAMHLNLPEQIRQLTERGWDFAPR